MKTTLEQVKADIASGKCTHIYYSAHTLWWTHLSEDLAESTKKGIAAQEVRMQEIMASDKVEQSKKNQLKALLEAGRKGSSVPMDPTGSPLLMTDKPDQWIKAAEDNPDHFGPCKLEAFNEGPSSKLFNICV